MVETSRILQPRKKKRKIKSHVSSLGRLVHEPSWGRGRAPMSRKTRMKLGWESSAHLESIIDIDDRQRVISTDEYPWCLIAFLEIEFPLGTSIGTGWLVGSDKVVTAGHCLYSEKAGGWAKSVKVIPGNDTENPTATISDDAPYGAFEAIALQTTEEWISNAAPEMDVGMIHINHPIGDDLGHFGISIYDDSDELNGEKLRIAGYPKYHHPLDKETDDLLTRKVAGQMWTHTDRLIDIKDGRIFYNLDTTGGQSGSPVVLLGYEALGLVAIGIHNYGFYDYEKHENKATLINEEIWGHIKGWLETDF